MSDGVIAGDRAAHRAGVNGPGGEHPRGFEVIAISFDEREAALSQFIKEHALPWPQEFEGKGWENQFAVRYGIFSIPTMWLVDKRGNLRDTNPGAQLEAHVTTLLDEKMPPGTR